jgi:hypothetical protein
VTPSIAELGERVLLPLVEGGELRPLPPIGGNRALEVAPHAELAGEAGNLVAWRRLRVARRLCPVDRLPAPSPQEWLLLAALNDLLQATNPDLAGMFGGDRPGKLITIAAGTIEQAGAPANLRDALGRHASFSRLLEVVRIDTEISWWVGRRTYHGIAPPPRMLAWKRLRRVQTRQEPVLLSSMAPETAAWSERWLEVLGRLLAATPLTDLSTLCRATPEFRWTGATLGLISTPAGRSLARRAIERAGSVRAVRQALFEAGSHLASAQPVAAGHAQAFADEIHGVATHPSALPEAGRGAQAPRRAQRA